MAKVITMGEVLIDFIPINRECKLKEVEGFIKKPGGAPANVAACVSRLGGHAKFIGKVGQDAFGEYLIDVLNEEKIDTDDVFFTDEANTALAFVSLTESGERDFSFYRKPSADMLLREEEIRPEIFREGDILHFCSVDLIESPVKYAHLKAIEYAKQNGSLISFDPNVRLPLWESPDDCRRTIKEFIPYADILKISEDELEFITETKDEKAAIQKILELNPAISWFILTKGEKGVEAIVDDVAYKVKGYQVDVKDTTGAGDSFIGAILYSLIEAKEKDIAGILNFANVVGALTTTREGAITALPRYEEVETFLQGDFDVSVNGKRNI
ncbi:PfkB family carbohydrate kinase [Mesobacillus subterraneus]|uniref:PfkB family carbohydrate kinase n=1 Tax=Mesobacillus subterraneus TaxID=285983 RepID=UPI001CFDFAE9|nr:PfkB family carbohydrate kinase [Mesobacillus subterraneus]WLR54673.1 PfkB family carbohydrate kinase [Mesobacillus subterraneus]